MQKVNLTESAKAARVFLGLLFLSTGVMKFAVPNLRAVSSGQLNAAGIPFHPLNMWMVPAVEIGLDVLFILRFLPRLANLSAIALMAVATYVHVVINDPALFPLQPERPIIPIIAMVLSFSLLWMSNRLGSAHLSSKRSLSKQEAGNSAIGQCLQSCTCGITPHDH